jgi:hypothetical protein
MYIMKSASPPNGVALRERKANYREENGCLFSCLYRNVMLASASPSAVAKWLVTVKSGWYANIGIIMAADVYSKAEDSVAYERILKI